MKIHHVFNLLVLCILLTVLGPACSTTHKVAATKTSGFLTDYHQLKTGTGDQPMMFYLDPDVKFNHYNKIIIEPVHLIISNDSDMAKVSEGDRQTIADYLYAALNENLSRRYAVVSEPGPQTMRLRFALTDITGTTIDPVTMSSVIPIAVVARVMAGVVTGSYMTVGSATGEMELLDSATGKRLIAAVGGRYGKEYTGKLDKWGEWNDAKDVCDYWAQQIAQHLEELSGEGDILDEDKK